MADYYGASFTIEKSRAKGKERGIELMKEVSKITREWAEERFGKSIKGETTGEWRDSNDALLQINEDMLGNIGFYDLMLDHPDSGFKTSRWRTDFRFATRGTGVDVDVEVRLLNDPSNDLENVGMASRPRILEIFFDRYLCRLGDEDLNKIATLVTPVNADEFVDKCIFDSNRRIPLVVVTKNSFGGIFVNPDRLQSRLLGIARVFTYDDETAQTVNVKLGALSVFGGAVRIYRPECTLDDFAGLNPFWKGRHIWEIGWEQLLQEVMEGCLFCSPPKTELSIYQEVKNKIYQYHLDELETSEILLDEYGGLQSENERLRGEVGRLEDINRRLNAENKQLKIVIQHSAKGMQENISDDALQDFNSVEDAVQHAQLSLGGLRFFDSAIDSARRSQFRRPNDVYKAFEALDDCASKLEQGSLGKSIQLWLKDEHNLEYTPTESPTTMGQYGRQREFTDNGKTLEMQAHVKLGGGGNDPQHQMRIHVRWKRSENKWLIGHVGEHLDTATG